MAGDPIFPPLTHTHTNTRWHPPHPFTPASFSISRSLNYRWNRRAKLLSRPRTITTRHRPPPIYLYSFPSRGERDRCLGSLNPSSFSPIENRGKKRVQAWRAIVNCRYVPPRRSPNPGRRRNPPRIAEGKRWGVPISLHASFRGQLFPLTHWTFHPTAGTFGEQRNPAFFVLGSAQ